MVIWEEFLILDWKKHNHASKLPRIGGMATMPTRDDTFRQMLGGILPQLDKLYIYFDKYDAIPGFVAGLPKVVPLRPDDHGDVQGDGKFVGYKFIDQPSLYFCFDDDILYPSGYVEIMASALERHDFKVIAGVHGSRFIPPYESYRRDKSVLHFARGCVADIPVDIIGTGTIAFHSETFAPDPLKWSSHKMTDLSAGIDAARRGARRVLVRRSAHMLRPLKENQDDSLYRQLLTDESEESRLMQQVIAEHPEWWMGPRMEARKQALE
jgi:hypothetical protein